MLPLTGAYTATFPKSFIQAARSNVILVTVLLISAIFLTSCGVSGVSAYAPHSAKATNINKSESSSTVDNESTGHITVSATLPHATVGKAYNAAVSVSGGIPPHQFSTFWEALPPGLTINPTTGTISGTPVTSGTYRFGILATDFPNSDRGDHRMTLVVDVPTVGIIVQVSPANATVLSGGTQQFTATVTGTSNVAVNWSATAGTVSNSGLFTAPIVSAVTTATVTAASVAQPSSSGSASVTINPQGPPPPPVPTITTTTIPDATAGVSYLTTLAATGGKLPYQWSILSGKLPNGIQLNSTSGSISGLTTVTGSFTFDVQVTDAAGQSDQATFTLLVLASVGNCGPPTYLCARTDTTVAQVPSPPNVGNLIGAGTIVTDPDFGSRILRVTDATTDLGTPGTYITASTGSADENLFNTDSTLFVINKTGTFLYPFTLDPTTMIADRMYKSSFPTTNGLILPGNSNASWSRVNSQILYLYTGNKVNSYDFTNRSTPPAAQLVYDFSTSAQCLGAGYTSIWKEAGGTDTTDTTFAQAWSATGPQDTAFDVAVYKVGQGCRHLNTVTGAITGDWGTNGNINLSDRFKVHNVKLSRDGNYLVIVMANGTCTTACATSAQYFWQVATNTLTFCVSKCLGHWVPGYSHWINNDPNITGQNVIRPFNNLAAATNLISQFPVLTSGFGQHQSWNNAGTADTAPVFLTGDTYPNPPLPSAWYQEVLADATDGSGKVWRFAHTFNSGAGGNFTTQNEIGSVSQDGRFYMWSSDWMGTLGSTSGASTCMVGTDCRGDVFVVEAQ